MCPSPNKRVAITFFKLKPDSRKVQPPPTMNPVTLWRPGTPAPPACGMVRAPLVMLAPAPKRLDTGTGVFLPWTPPVSRKPAKHHLPPRVQRLRLLSSAKSVADRESSSPEIGVSWVGTCHTRNLFLFLFLRVFWFHWLYTRVLLVFLVSSLLPNNFLPFYLLIDWRLGYYCCYMIHREAFVLKNYLRYASLAIYFKDLQLQSR